MEMTELNAFWACYMLYVFVGFVGIDLQMFEGHSDGNYEVNEREVNNFELGEIEIWVV